MGANRESSSQSRGFKGCDSISEDFSVSNCLIMLFAKKSSLQKKRKICIFEWLEAGSLSHKSEAW